MDRRVEPLRGALRVIGIDHQHVVHLFVGAGEPREHQRAAVVDPGGGVLLGDQVHAVAQRRDQSHVGRAVHRDQIFLGLVLVAVVDGNATLAAETPVDTPDHLLDLLAQLLIDVHLGPRGGRDLDEGEASLQLLVAVEHDLHRVQALEDALRVVQPIDAEHQDIRTVGIADRGDLPGDRLMRRQFGEVLEVDADRKATYAHRPAVHADLVRTGEAVRGYLGDDVHEVAGVGVEVEPDQIRAEHAVGQLLGVWFDQEDLRTGERDMQEEGDAGGGEHATHQRRHQHQVIVVDPDQVAWLVLLDDRLGEAGADRLETVPVTAVELAVFLKVVEQRPECFVGVAQIEAVDLFPGQRERLQFVFLLRRFSFFQRDLVGHLVEATRPADPRSAARAQDRIQRRDQSADTAFVLDLTVFVAEVVRQSIADDQESVGQNPAVDHQGRRAAGVRFPFLGK